MNNEDRKEALTLEILEAIDERSDVTQRGLARHTGVALGLANSYLKRCVRKGLVKIQQAPANRYLYYLTPKGFAEKSRLTAQYLSYSFTFYRRAGESCARAFQECRAKQWTQLGLYGGSDLAEIAAIRALEADVEILAVCDPGGERASYLNIPVVRDPESAGDVDAWVITDLSDPFEAHNTLSGVLPGERIVVPDILAISKTN
jgi:DNA-binding MarR family transcriptional regulator